jgi:hypothetical protein
VTEHTPDPLAALDSLADFAALSTHNEYRRNQIEAWRAVIRAAVIRAAQDNDTERQYDDARTEAERRYGPPPGHYVSTFERNAFVEGAVWSTGDTEAAWDEGFEAGATFRVEQVGPSGVPTDPPRNPYPGAALATRHTTPPTREQITRAIDTAMLRVDRDHERQGRLAGIRPLADAATDAVLALYADPAPRTVEHDKEATCTDPR